MKKLTFDEALERINEQRHINAADVQSRALSRRVWVAEWHLPGCLSESFDVCLTKAEAIRAACAFAEGEDGAPRGMKSALRKLGRFDSHSELFGSCINTIKQQTLSDLL